MKTFNESEFQLVNIYIGLTIKLCRLKKGLSQLQFANLIDSNNTAIGRIERAEHFSAWDKILYVCQYLGIDFSSLLAVKSKKSLLSIVDECYELETKLTKEKDIYYKELRLRIEKLFRKLDK